MEEQKQRGDSGASGDDHSYSHEILLDLLLGRKPRTREQIIASRQVTRQTVDTELGYDTVTTDGSRKTVQQMVIESTEPLPKEEKKKAHWFGSIRLFFEEDIKWGDELGRGNFGKAVLGRIKDANTQRERTIVVKIPSYTYGINHELVNELLAMANLPAHKNILQLLGIVTIDQTDSKKVCFITDYCEMGSVDKLHDKMDMSSEQEFLRISLGVAEGLSHLHAKRIIHRDLACRNLLMRNDNTVVICDFGLSRIIEQDDGYTAQSSKFPWAWTSPETLKNGRFDVKSDIWSLGITMWELLTKGQKPYAEYSHRRKFVIQAIKEGNLKVKVPESASVSCKRIVDACIRFDPASRPTAADLVSVLRKLRSGEMLEMDSLMPSSNLNEYGVAASDGVTSAKPDTKHKKKTSLSIFSGSARDHREEWKEQPFEEEASGNANANAEFSVSQPRRAEFSISQPARMHRVESESSDKKSSQFQVASSESSIPMGSRKSVSKNTLLDTKHSDPSPRETNEEESRGPYSPNYNPKGKSANASQRGAQQKLDIYKNSDAVIREVEHESPDIVIDPVDENVYNERTEDQVVADRESHYVRHVEPSAYRLGVPVSGEEQRARSESSYGGLHLAEAVLEEDGNNVNDTPRNAHGHIEYAASASASVSRV